MIKFLDMENATLDLNLKSLNAYKNFFEKYSNEINNLNFKRLLVNIDEKDLNEIIETIEKTIISNILIMLKVKLNELKKYKLPESFIIVNTNKNLIIKDEQIYNLINLNSNTKKRISQLINDNVNVIIKPQVNINKIKNFNDNLNYILKKSVNKDINLDGYILETSLIKEHPCNAYLCGGWKCNLNIKGLPKNIYIGKNLKMYPHNLQFDTLYIGQLGVETIDTVLSNYLKSIEHTKFINSSKKAFIKYVAKFPYQFIPLIDYIRVEVQNEYQG